MVEAPLRIYTPSRLGRRVQPTIRIIAAGVALGCLGLLIVAAWLHPDSSGTGTHEQLHMPACQFLQHTGLPCPTCGMTTSFSWFVRGNLLASFYLQPMGMVLAMFAAAGVWMGFYIALTGRSLSGLIQRVPMGPLITALLVFAAIAWGWKIFLHVRGMDGWN